MPTTGKTMKQNAQASPDSSREEVLTVHLAQRIIDGFEKIATGKSLADATASSNKEDPNAKELKPRASKLAYKEVNEVWDEKAYKYVVKKPVAPKDETDELHQYVFVVRARIDRKTEVPVFYMDIMSPSLRDILKAVLQDVRGVSLAEDMPSVERDVLYHYVAALGSFIRQRREGVDSIRAQHLTLLIDYMHATYKSINARINALHKRKEITYDLLPFLFKPDVEIYCICPGTNASRCLRYIHGEEKVEDNGSAYFSIQGYYFDFDGTSIGQATGILKIDKFRGPRQIDTLITYPLQFHPEAEKVRISLAQRGRLFLSLRGIHHRHYEGFAFRLDDQNKMRIYQVSSRIMIDTVGFHESNPKYPRRRVSTKGSTLTDTFLGQVWGEESEATCTYLNEENEVKHADIDPEAPDDEALVCFSPLVLGFSMKDRLFLEFAVFNIHGITWSLDPLGELRIPENKKATIKALTDSHLRRKFSDPFDDIVKGKGRGLNLLLYGPSGVGKTLTAETIAESYKRPLYSIAAGELGTQAELVDSTISTIFKLTSRWKAILLIDEADVFLAKRSIENGGHNALVSIFLRQLEYYQGILFLTTNRVYAFDEAVMGRVHHGVRYDSLDKCAREDVWRSFLLRAITEKGEAKYSLQDLESLVSHDLNGREIKNAVSTAYALASHANDWVRASHLKNAIEALKAFKADFETIPVGIYI